MKEMPSLILQSNITKVIPKSEVSKRPSILVFDGGVGCWPIASGLSEVGFNVTQLGHLRKFPFGRMTKAQLKEMVCDVAFHAAQSGFDALVIASNTPTIMVGEEVPGELREANVQIPVYGVEPPIRQAFDELEKRDLELKVCVLGTRAMVNSAQMREYADRNTSKGGVTILEDASFLIESHVEGNSTPDQKSEAVNSFIRELINKHGDIPAYTLSSTHLPILRRNFEEACPESLFFDPAVGVIQRISKSLGIDNATTKEPGNIEAIYTEPDTADPQQEINSYSKRLDNIAGRHVEISPVPIADGIFSRFKLANKFLKT